MHTRRLQAIILIALTLLVVWAVQASTKQQSSEYCSSCHTVFAKSWRESGHSSVGCYDCHAEPGLKGWIEFRLALQRMIRVSKSGQEPHFDMVTSASDQCAGCHTKASSINETDAMVIPHGLHDSVGIDCYGCHAGLVHGLDGTKPIGMNHDTCIDCHEGWISDEDSCMVCHKGAELRETDTMYIPHDIHSFMSCGTCHGPMWPPEVMGSYEMSHDTCIQCHEDIISDVNECGVCHKPVAVVETETLYIPHDIHSFMQCGACHGPQAPPEAKAAYKISHDTCVDCHEDVISDVNECGVCHKPSTVTETDSMYIPHETHSFMQCGACHGPQAPPEAKAAYSMSHDTCIQCHEDSISDVNECGICHKAATVSETKYMKIPHEVHSFMQCGSCHGPQAPPAAKAAYSMSHDTCIQCHEQEISDVKECGICHKGTPVTETRYMNIPHEVHSFMQCGACHGPQAPAKAKAAYSMSHDTCIQCHEQEISDVRECGICHKGTAVTETKHMNIPHEVHSFMQCGACHGPMAPPEAKAAYSMSHDTCIQCHEQEIADVDECGICHKPVTVMESDALYVPHDVHSFLQCGACHGPMAPPEAKAAYSMSHDTCVQCHEQEIATVTECGVCHKPVTVMETDALYIPHASHWFLQCGACHGPMAPPEAKEAYSMGHDACIDCHDDIISNVNECGVCHKPSTVTETETLRIPHDVHSFMQCGACHGPMAPPEAVAAWDINHDTCAPCHDMEDYDACELCHKW